MKKVDQQFTHQPEIGQHGDCMRAVLASILNAPIGTVPHFAQEHAEGRGNFWDLVSDYLQRRQLALVMVKAAPLVWYSAPIYHLISGPSPRGNGVTHVVVGLNGAIEHDPHPSRAGLAGTSLDWTFYFLVPVQ